MLAIVYNDDDELNINLHNIDDEFVKTLLELAENNSGDTTDSDSNVDDDVKSDNCANFLGTCHNMACAQVLTPFKKPFQFTLQVESRPVQDATAEMKKRYDDTLFRGTSVDLGCLHLSTGGVVEYIAYCKENGLKPTVKNNKHTFIVFANRIHISPETAHIGFHVNKQWLTCEVNLLPLYLTVLLSLQDMDRLGIYFENLSNEVVHKA